MPKSKQDTYDGTEVVRFERLNVKTVPAVSLVTRGVSPQKSQITLWESD